MILPAIVFLAWLRRLLLNNLGATPTMELYIAARHTILSLRARGTEARKDPIRSVWVSG